MNNFFGPMLDWLVIIMHMNCHDIVTATTFLLSTQKSRQEFGNIAFWIPLPETMQGNWSLTLQPPCCIAWLSELETDFLPGVAEFKGTCIPCSHSLTTGCLQLMVSWKRQLLTHAWWHAACVTHLIFFLLFSSHRHSWALWRDYSVLIPPVNNSLQAKFFFFGQTISNSNFSVH